MLRGYSTGRRANARRAAHLKVFWFFFPKKNRFDLVSKKEPLRFGFQKRTVSLWFPEKEPLRFSLKKPFY
jgi:hypothetical protein